MPSLCLPLAAAIGERWAVAVLGDDVTQRVPASNRPGGGGTRAARRGRGRGCLDARRPGALAPCRARAFAPPQVADLHVHELHHRCAVGHRGARVAGSIPGSTGATRRRDASLRWPWRRHSTWRSPLLTGADPRKRDASGGRDGSAPVAVTSFLVYTPVVAGLAVRVRDCVAMDAPAVPASRFGLPAPLHACTNTNEPRGRSSERPTKLSRRANLSFAGALIATLDARDRYTAGHSAAVAIYSRDIAS